MNKVNLTKTEIDSFKNDIDKRLNRNNEKFVIATKEDLEKKLDVFKSEVEVQNVELLEIQEKLLKSIEEYTELFEQAPIGYFILDKEGIILKVNETGNKLLKEKKKQLIGKHLSIFINSKSCQDRFYIHKNLVIESRKKEQFECKMKQSDGSLLPVLLETSFVKDEKKKFKFLFCNITDISKQKEQEKILSLALVKEKKLHEMKSQFITIASHEFRTPLATILTSAELMEKYTSLNQAENRVKHYRKIRSAVNRLGEILIDFLSANDIEKGKIKNNPELFNIQEFTQKIIDETRTFNGTHAINYNHIGNYENVFLDMKLFKTCITNLIINAYKYTPDGGIIEITTEHTVSDGVIFIIKDSGIGIPESEQQHIFQTFFRAKNAENIQGTGMGLSITKDLAKIMKGQISFESHENVGTTFTLKFPQQ